jgi:hypothetical protein
MVNAVMPRLLTHKQDVPSRARTMARRLTLSVAVQRFGVVFWLLLCVAFWIGVARLIF